MIYDEDLDQLMGFGGKNYRYVFQNKTFTIKGKNIVMIADEGPSARHSLGLTYDSNNMVTYLFGGKEYKEGGFNALVDFWKWNGSNWEEVE